VAKPRSSMWNDVLAFLLLASATIVMLLVLFVTRAYYATFEPFGRFLAWFVVVGGVVALASLASSLLRLYIRPAWEEGRARRRRGNA